MDWFIAAVLIGLAGMFLLTGSNYILDYALFIYVFNRGLRRVLDWMAGSFQPLSPISICPLLIFGLLMFPFLARFHLLPKYAKTIFYCLFTAIGLAFVVGFARVQLAALFALAESIAPFAVFGYVLTAPATQAVKDRWLRSAAWCAILASAYGWYQYFTIPPWDAFWVRAVGFEGYLGQLVPTKMIVFSTMAERGPFGAFLGFALVPMVICPRWRTKLGWTAIILVFSALLLTMTRTGIIVAVLTILIFVMINRGAGLGQTAFVFGLIGLGLIIGLQSMPGGERVQQRLSSISTIQQDGSYQGRLFIYRASAVTILSTPLGFGLGATGLAGRVNTGTQEGQGVIGDAGYLEIPATYGWLGAILIVTALWKMWKEMTRRFHLGCRAIEVLLGRAFLIALIPACFVGNAVTQFSILWLIFGLALRPELVRLPRRAPRPAGPGTSLG